jgi:single-strand DNA-binding protein
MNVCTFSGRLTRDCEVRTTQSGTTVSSFSIAVDGGFGEHKRTDFINCKFFKREGLAPHLTKGKPVMVSGELQTEKWTDKQGNERTGFSIICRDIDFQQGFVGGATGPSVPEAGVRKDMDELDDAPF